MNVLVLCILEIQTYLCLVHGFLRWVLLIKWSAYSVAQSNGNPIHFSTNPPLPHHAKMGGIIGMYLREPFACAHGTL